MKRQQRWCALVILLAVCALTVRLATRYASAEDVSTATFTKVHQQVSQAPARQRLIETAAAWQPPVVQASGFDCLAYYPRISPAGPPIASVLFEKSLYNRPPPSSILFL